MNDAVIELLLSCLWALGLAYIVYLVTVEFREEAKVLGASQIQEGDTKLSELYMQMSPQTFFMLRVLIAVVCFFIGVAAVNHYLGAGLAIAGYVIPGIMLNRLRLKRVHLVEQQLVEGLELLGNSLKSGLTLQQAVELLVKEFPPPISQEFALVLSENRLGVEFTDALINMANRLKSNIVQILATGVVITKRVGGDLTVIFANIAATIREQANIEGKLNAVTAQGRFQGLVLGLMPFALMILLYFVDRNHIETLFGYQLGLWAVALVVVMVILAQAWIRKLMDIDV